MCIRDSFLIRKEDLEDICRLVSKILYTLCLGVRPFLCLNYMGGGGLEEDWGGLEKDWRRVGEGLEKDRRRIGEGLEKDRRRIGDGPPMPSCFVEKRFINYACFPPHN